MTHASGIWMDWENINSRCSQNVVLNTDSIFGGIFIEASQAPNMADHNFVWGSTKHGIFPALHRAAAACPAPARPRAGPPGCGFRG